jgi:hypothetical protein
LWLASSKRWTGNTSGAGKPPANEIMPGFCVTFNKSRMAELVMPFVRSA